MTLRIIDEGIKEYSVMLSKQRKLFSAMVDKKKKGIPIEEEYIMMVEHPSVITMGKHARNTNVLIEENELTRLGIRVHHIERGGDVTFHGPGQLVVYPILDLEAHKLGVKDYVDLLEEAVIQTISEFGIQGERIKGANGVWIGAGTAHERKICALGIKCSRYISMHGLALNVNTDLNGFHMINPCGFTDKGVTSMKAERNKQVDINLIKKIMAERFRQLLGYT
ncbi:MAG: lipoyl(octanoyl) transferase LipB [Muribaculaceae bacterium]|nr:lipoyl(octanoyl) transferase LipB [Muribaculaceae bacterium]